MAEGPKVFKEDSNDRFQWRRRPDPAFLAQLETILRPPRSIYPSVLNDSNSLKCFKAQTTVTTKKVNSRDSRTCQIRHKRKFNWDWEWNYFDLHGIPQSSFSYLWVFPTEVLPFISFLMRLVVHFSRFSQWLSQDYWHKFRIYIRWMVMTKSVVNRYISFVEFWLFFQVPWIVDLVACDKHLWFFRLSIFSCVSIRLPSEGGKCKDPLYLSEPLHYLYISWVPAWLVCLHEACT